MLLRIITSEIAFYWVWWLCFAAIAFCSTRYFGWYGLLGGVLLISILIIGIEVHSVFQDMRAHPESERDADFVFWWGVQCRIILYNVLLMPAGIVGAVSRSRSRRT